jgi:UDP-glucuronate decarboxylase
MKNDSVIRDDIKKVLGSNFIDYNKLSNSNYLVTGASGMLCSFLVKVLLSMTSGKVFALFRNQETFDEAFYSFINNPNLIPIKCDVSDFRPELILDKIDYIIHGASAGSPKSYIQDPIGVFKANCIGAIKMLNFMKLDSRIKTITFISSAEVYGNIINTDFIKEEYQGIINQLDLRSCYAESKRMSENIISSWCKINNRNFNIIRPFHTYGPSMKIGDGRIFADIVESVVNSKDIILNSDGSSIRAFCYLVDFASALLAIISSNKVNEAWNIGNPDEAISMANLANMVSTLIAEKTVNVIIKGQDQKTHDIQKIIPDISKLKSLGWSKQINNRSGFERTIKHYLLNK